MLTIPTYYFWMCHKFNIYETDIGFLLRVYEPSNLVLNLHVCFVNYELCDL